AARASAGAAQRSFECRLCRKQRSGSTTAIRTRQESPVDARQRIAQPWPAFVQHRSDSLEPEAEAILWVFAYEGLWKEQNAIYWRFQDWKLLHFKLILSKRSNSATSNLQSPIF